MADQQNKNPDGKKIPFNKSKWRQEKYSNKQKGK